MTSPRQAIFGPNPATTSLSGVPWAPGYTGPRITTRTVGSMAAPGGTGTGVRDNNGRELTPEELRRWDEYVARTVDMINKSTGWEREKLRLQLKDAEKGRANAYRIAELSANTSRYGTDQQTMVELRRLQENQRQFDANHGLEQQKLGLSVADTYTKYAQSYDDIWALQDFKGALGAVQGGGGPAPIAAQGRPQPKTWESFAALAGFENLPAVQAGTAPAPMPGGGQAAAGGGGGNGADLRLKAAKAIGEAMPPSSTPGLDDQDWAAIRAYESLYFAGQPGTVEKLGTERNRIGMAGLARAGYNPKLVEEERRRSLPHQGSVRAA